MKSSNRNIFLNRSDFQKELIDVWRVVAAVVLAQVSAGGLAVLFGRYGIWFIDFWFGGAVGSVFGYLAGLSWQMRAQKCSWQIHRQMLLFIGFVSIALFIAAFTLPLDQAAAAPARMTEQVK